MIGKSKYVVLALSGFAAPAFAQGGGIGLGEIQGAATRAGDKSLAALELLFGPVVRNPIAGFSGGSMIAEVFLVLNSCILAVGVLWAVYLFASAIMATGQDGELLGQKKSSPWFVIRMFTGFVSLVPIFGGFAGAQILILWGAQMGIGIANLSTDAAVHVLRAGGSMVATPPAPQTAGLAKHLLEANLCAESANAALDLLPGEAGVSANEGERFAALTAPRKIVLMSATGLSCGGAEITHRTDDRSWGAISSAHDEALTSMQGSLNQAARQFVGAVIYARAAPDMSGVIHRAAKEYEAHMQRALQSSQGNVNQLAARIEADLQRDGWLMLGAWYQTFALANTGLTRAMNAAASGVPGTQLDQLPYPQILRKVMAAYEQQGSRGASIAQATDPIRTVGYSGSDDKNFMQRVFDSGSLGQTITTSLIGLNNTHGTESGTNPLIGMKNLGDTILNIGGGAITAWAGLRVAEKVAKKNILGWATDKLFGWTGLLEGLIDSLGVFVYMGIIALFMFGATLSVYIPLIPFIIWFGGIIAWLAIVAEGVIAAPLWAMAHLDGDGEGMGHRTTHGYIFLLNVLFRPVLMTLGFLVGGGILVVGGTYLNPGFAQAMANAQFDSWSGLVAVLGYIFAYVSLCLILIHASFNLIHIVPDQVLAWVGGGMASRLGQDTDDRAQNVFVAGVGHARSAAGNAMPRRRPAVNLGAGAISRGTSTPGK